MFREVLTAAGLAVGLVLTDCAAAAELRFEQTPLREALQQLQDQTGQRLVYAEELLTTAAPVTFAAPAGLSAARVLEEVLRRQGLVAIASATGPWAVVPVTDPLGRCKAVGAAMRTFVELAVKLDDARVAGDALQIPSWTADDDRRLAYALIDLCGAVARDNLVRPLFGAEAMLAEWTRAAQCGDPEVRAGVIYRPLIYSGWGVGQDDPLWTKLEALYRQGLTDPDPLPRAAVLLTLAARQNDDQDGELAAEFLERAERSAYAGERFAAVLVAARLAERRLRPPADAGSRLLADPCAAVRVLSQAADLYLTARLRPAGDLDAAMRPALARAHQDANPLVRTLLPVILTLVRLENRPAGARLPGELPDVVAGEDGWAKLCQGYLRTLAALLREPTAPAFEAALASTTSLLESPNRSSQMLPFGAIPLALACPYLLPAPGEAAPGNLRRIDRQPLLQPLAVVVGSRLARPNAPAIRGTTVQALLNAENPWLRAAFANSRFFLLLSGERIGKELPLSGLLDAASLEQCELAFRRGLAADDELDRVPALLAAYTMAYTMPRTKETTTDFPSDILPLLHHARQSRRLSENLLASRALAKVLPFTESLTILKQNLDPGVPPWHAAVWLSSLLDCRWTWPEDQRIARRLQILEVVLAARSPALEQVLLAWTLGQFEYGNEERANPAVALRFIEGCSPATLPLLPLALRRELWTSYTLRAALLQRSAKLLASPAAADRDVAGVLLRKTIEDVVLSPDSRSETGRAFQAALETGVQSQLTQAEKPNAEAVRLLAATLVWRCQKVSYHRDDEPALSATLQDGIRKALTLAGDAAYHDALLELASALERRLYDQNHQHADQGVVRESLQKLAAGLLAAGSADVQVRLQIILAGNDLEWATRLADGLLAGTVPAARQPAAIAATRGQAARLPPAYHEFLFGQLTGANCARRRVANSALCLVPGLEDRLVTAVLKLLAADPQAHGDDFFTLLVSDHYHRAGRAVKDQPPPAWVKRIRDYALPELQRRLAQPGSESVSSWVQLLSTCGADPQVEQAFIAALRNPQLQAPDGPDHLRRLAHELAWALSAVAPGTACYARLLEDDGGYAALSPASRLTLAIAAARSPKAARAAEFLVKVFRDEAVIAYGRSHPDEFWNLEMLLPPDPEQVAVFQALARRPDLAQVREPIASVLEKLGHPLDKPPVVGAPVAQDLIGAEFAARQQSPEGRIEGCLPKLGTVTLDGELAEWGAAAAVPLRYASYIAHRLDFHAWNGPADCGAEVLCGWNADGLCLAGFVADDDVRNDTQPEDSYQQDCVELYVDARRGTAFMQPPYTPGAYQLFVRPPVGGRAARLAGNADYGTVEGARVAGKLVPGGWTFEVVIPWRAFPDYQPQAGSVLGLQFGLDDYDARDGNERQPLLMTWQAATMLFKSPEKLVKWTLVDALPRGARAALGPTVAIELPVETTDGTAVKANVELGRTLAALAAGGVYEVKARTGAVVAKGQLAFAKLAPPWPDSSGAAFDWLLGETPDGVYTVEVTVADATGAALGVARRHVMLRRGKHGEVPTVSAVRATLKLATPGLAALAFDARQQQVLTAGAGGLQRYDSQTGKLLATLTDQDCAAVCVMPTLIAFAQGNDIRLVGATDGAARGELKGHTKSVRALAATADGQRLASVALDGSVRLWDLEPRQELRQLTFKKLPRCVAFAPDGTRLAVGCRDFNVYLVDVASGATTATLSGHSYSPRCLAFAPDGKQLLSGSDDLQAILWDAATGKRLRTLTGHSSLVTGVAFTADGKQAVTGAQDGSVRLWDLALGKDLRCLCENQPGFTALALSGATVIVGGQGADVLVLDLAP